MNTDTFDMDVDFDDIFKLCHEIDASYGDQYCVSESVELSEVHYDVTNEVPLESLHLVNELLGLSNELVNEPLDLPVIEPNEFPFSEWNELPFSESNELPFSESNELPFSESNDNQQPSSSSSSHATFTRKHDTIGPHVMYQMQQLPRGKTDDTYYQEPLYASMVSNIQLINTINYGTDEQMASLPNFSNQTPKTKSKCDQALENKMFVDATFVLTSTYGVTQLPDIYRRIALLGDRVCLGCEKPSLKTSCMCGKFRCHRCIQYGRDVDFNTGFHQWLMANCPSRHAYSV